MRNPTLGTLKIIEEYIAMNSGKLGRYQLWKMLPKRMQYGTFQEAISHLVWAERVELRGKKLHYTFKKDMGDER